MDKMKSLNDVLPAEKRMVSSVKLADILRKPAVVYSATFTTVGNTVYARMLVTCDGLSGRASIPVNTPQIVEALEYINDAKAFPLRVMFIPNGKSYAIVDPGDYQTPVEKSSGEGVSNG